MDLKERLNRLTSFSRTQEESKVDISSDLRERLDRLLDPRRVYGKKSRCPVEKLITGEIVSTPAGETFRAIHCFPSDYQYGEMALSEILEIPTYPAHLLSKNEQLKGMDLRKACLES